MTLYIGVVLTGSASPEMGRKHSDLYSVMRAGLMIPINWAINRHDGGKSA